MALFGLQVISNAIGFLASAAERNQYKYLFEKQETLESICANVVLPNVEFRGKFLLYSVLFNIIHHYFCLIMFNLMVLWYRNFKD